MKGIRVLTKAIVLLTKTFIIVLRLCNHVHILPPVLHNHIVPLWWYPQPIISVMTRCVVRESNIYTAATQTCESCLNNSLLCCVVLFAVRHNSSHNIFPQELKHDLHLLLQSSMCTVKKSSVWRKYGREEEDVYLSCHSIH